MKNTLPVLFLFAVLIFNACEQAVMEDLQPQLLVEEVQQDVVFQYTVQDFAAEKVTGWLINGTGGVMTFSMNLDAYFADQPLLADLELRMLKQASVATGKKVNFTAFKALVEQLENVQHEDLDAVNINEDFNQSTTIVAYRQDLQYRYDQADRSCDNYVLHNDAVYEQLILQQSGRYNQVNQGAVAETILEWLLETGAEL
ncbi:MAG: hypothetical protein AB8G22_14150 [Saprospiraceae bacterium]